MPSAIRALARTAVLSTLFAFAGETAALPVSTQFTVTGVAAPDAYDLAALQARPATIQTVAFLAGGTPQTHTYTGTSLWGVLDRAGIVTNPGVRNDILNKFVLATATDGYRVVFSLGELSPAFGNRPDLVAYAEAIGGATVPLGNDGFARITAPGDIRGGRYLSNLTGLQVQDSASRQEASGGGVSTAFTVSGDVRANRTFDLAALQALPTVMRTIGTTTYTGVSLWDLLTSSVGIPVDASLNNDILGKYVVATGSDGYRAVFSLGELHPFFGNQPDFIAYAMEGGSLGANGFARIVAPNDVRAGRWVSNLISLEVFTPRAIPEPATWLMTASGLVVMGGIAWRRRRDERSTPR